jgi:N-terminal phage replisome organiser (Phage_rep_org_N)
MSNNTPWFRFYSEALSDRKIARVCSMTRQPKFAILGVWTAMLSMANDSPERGLLLIGEDLPLTLDEIFFEIGIDPEIGEIIITAFIQVGMVSRDGDTYSITHWDDRQFASDNSTDRVKKFRDKKRREALSAAQFSGNQDPESETIDDDLAADDSNVAPTESDGYKKRYSETGVKRFSNVIESESDTESTPNGVTENPVEAAGKSSHTKRDVDKSSLPTGDDLLQADTPLKQIMGTFLVKTSYKLPTKKTNRNFWWSEVRELLNIADGDSARAQKLVEMAVDEMKRDKLSIVSPKSIVGTAQKLASSLSENNQQVVASY